MFGVLEKDNLFSNVRIEAQTTAGKLSTPLIIGQNYVSYPNTSTPNLTVPVGPYSVIDLGTLDNSSSPVAYNLAVDSSNLVVGDMVVLVFRVAVPEANAVTIILPPNVLSTFGNEVYASELDITNYLYYNLELLFDGSFLLNTFEFY
jgi:hypothetical protein